MARTRLTELFEHLINNERFPSVRPPTSASGTTMPDNYYVLSTFKTFSAIIYNAKAWNATVREFAGKVLDLTARAEHMSQELKFDRKGGPGEVTLFCDESWLAYANKEDKYPFYIAGKGYNYPTLEDVARRGEPNAVPGRFWMKKQTMRDGSKVKAKWVDVLEYLAEDQPLFFVMNRLLDNRSAIQLNPYMGDIWASFTFTYPNHESPRFRTPLPRVLNPNRVPGLIKPLPDRSMSLLRVYNSHLSAALVHAFALTEPLIASPPLNDSTCSMPEAEHLRWRCLESLAINDPQLAANSSWAWTMFVLAMGLYDYDWSTGKNQRLQQVRQSNVVGFRTPVQRAGPLDESRREPRKLLWALKAEYWDNSDAENAVETFFSQRSSRRDSPSEASLNEESADEQPPVEDIEPPTTSQSMSESNDMPEAQVPSVEQDGEAGNIQDDMDAMQEELNLLKEEILDGQTSPEAMATAKVLLEKMRQEAALLQERMNHEQKESKMLRQRVKGWRNAMPATEPQDEGDTSTHGPKQQRLRAAYADYRSLERATRFNITLETIQEETDEMLRSLNIREAPTTQEEERPVKRRRMGDMVDIWSLPTGEQAGQEMRDVASPTETSPVDQDMQDLSNLATMSPIDQEMGDDRLVHRSRQ